MPIIHYTIQKNICKIIGKRKCWCSEYEHILVDVNDAVAEFLSHENKQERRYQWKIKKQMQDARISRTVNLDEIKYDSDTNEQYLVADTIEDIINHENRNPLSIIIEREFTDTLYKIGRAHV